MLKKILVALFCVLLFRSAPARSDEAPAAVPGEQVLFSITLPYSKPLAFDTDAEFKTDFELPYWVYLPICDTEKTAEGYPLIIFLHGSEERGKNEAALKAGLPRRVVKEKETWPFITVTPVCPVKRRWIEMDLRPLVEHLIAEYPVDPDRVYLTGLSMGGFGTWDALLKDPDLYAAAAPIAGGCEAEWAPRLLDIPIWAFHGEEDPTVRPAWSIDICRAIEEQGGEKIRLSLFPDAEHDVWTPAYKDPEFYRWLLSHRLSERAPLSKEE